MPAAVYRIRFVRSKKRLDAIGPILKEVNREFDSKIMPRAKTLLNRFTATGWSERPRMAVKSTWISATIKKWIRPITEVERWVWVSQGTSSHGVIGSGGYEIPLKPGKLLRFQARYDPATLPGGKFGGAGEKYGHWRKEKVVTHFGIAPREFEHHAAIWLDQWGWRRRIENAIRRGLRVAAKQQKAQTVEV